MKIEVTDTFKSVDPFIWEDIPPLSIITGLNGAGKSQLLKLIRSNPSIVSTDDSSSYSTEDITFWNSDGGRFPNSHSFQLFDLIGLAAILRSHSDPLKKVIKVALPNERVRHREEQGLQKALTKLSINIVGREDEIISLMEQSSGKAFVNLGFEEIMYHFPEELFLDSDNISNDRIETLFYMYHFRKSIDQKNGKDMSNYPLPPWDLLNQVFDISNLPFEIDNPTAITIDFDVENLDTYFKQDPKYQYQLKLTHKLLNKVVDFKDISSGEKTIMSLAFLHYYAQKKNSYKKLLLLDEPDAHLHPSLTKQFLEVVDKFLIKKYDAKVILTTHSPSTIGLCDKDSIFVMSKNPTIIRKQDRQEAINYLTSGVPTLSSIVDNRRYILVEDKDDVDFYTKIYDLVSANLSNEIGLIFLPVSANRINRSGGCKVVREWTRKLRSEGNMTLAKGIIDRDRSNTGGDGLTVLKRYSMENYLLEPLIIAGYQIHNGIINQIGSISFPNKNCNKLENLTQAELQGVVNHITDHVESNFTSTVDNLNVGRAADNLISNNTLTTAEKTKVSVELQNGITLDYPKWFINRRGHDLESIFRELFSSGQRFGLNPLLDIHERLPIFIPKNLIESLRETI